MHFCFYLNSCFLVEGEVIIVVGTAALTDREQDLVGFDFLVDYYYDHYSKEKNDI